MNLGQAVAVCLYELARSSRHVAIPETGQPANRSGDIDRVAALLLEALDASGSLKSLPPLRALKKSSGG